MGPDGAAAHGDGSDTGLTRRAPAAREAAHSSVPGDIVLEAGLSHDSCHGRPQTPSTAKPTARRQAQHPMVGRERQTVIPLADKESACEVHRIERPEGRREGLCGTRQDRRSDRDQVHAVDRAEGIGEVARATASSLSRNRVRALSIVRRHPTRMSSLDTLHGDPAP